jgi:cobalt-zinc-cadmium efflux system outer membrane protein
MEAMLRGAGLVIPLVLLTAAAVEGQFQPAPAPSPLSLEEALAQALQANPTLTAARLRRAIDLAGIDVARERPNPELRYEQSKETPHQSLTAAQLLELGGKRGRRIALAEAVAKSGEAELARVVAETRSQVRHAYYAMAGVQRRIAVAEELRALADQARSVASARLEVGDVSRLDLVQAEVALFEAENEATALEGERRASGAELNALLGRDVLTPVTVSPEIDAEAFDAETALARALATNAALAVADQQIAEARARLALARAEQVPDPTIEGAVTHDAPGEFVWGWRYAVAVAVPVFTRHRAQARVEEATVTQLQAERTALEQRIRGFVVSAAARAAAQRQQYLRYRDEILPKAREAEAMAEESYRAGQTGLPALLQSLQQARELRAKAAQAAADYQAALADLERAAALAPQ